MIQDDEKVRHPDNIRHRIRPILSDRGFTFIEMIISLALMATLASIVGMGLVAAMQSFSFSRANVDVLQKGQMAMDRIARELTELTTVRGVSDQGHYIVYDRVVRSSDGTMEMATYCLQFDVAGSRVLLFTDLPSSTTTPPETGGDLLCDEVGNLYLQFFQGEATWTMTPSDINQLSTIQIQLDLIRPDAPDMTHQFATLVYLRNTGNLGGAM